MMITVGYFYNFYRNKIHLRHVEMCIHLTVLCLNWSSDSWMPHLQTKHPQLIHTQFLQKLNSKKNTSHIHIQQIQTKHPIQKQTP